ncbi:hypothetical protein JVT61DRAFT_13372 [Boletus reticuloceps]|uniref:Uncharacterized protein n=1 Tax=Boletus reticuloceps TaxID=495285 RepID=A0A8I3A3M2_9AGAM|nr:hypothetical protein JVT61DRAFT_13372 [Boletus reticuloceps]
MTDHASNWATSSSLSQAPLLDPGTPTAPLASGQCEVLGDCPISDPATLINRATSPDERLLPPTARPTLDTCPNDDPNPETHFLTQVVQSVDRDRCLSIVESVQTPFFDKLVFDNVTPEEFNLISTLPAEDRRYRSIAKLVYLPDLHRLVAMAPYAIHEAPILHFSKRVDKMLSRLSLDDDNDVAIELHTNLAIDDGAATNLIIPDFRLDLCSRRVARSPSVPFWVGEIGLSSGVPLMRRQLVSAARMAPELDFAFMISIRERARCSPPIDHPLRSRPYLSYAAFEHLIAVNAAPLPPVVVEDICWAEIKSITFHCFLREDNDQFDFSGKGSLCARGTLFPNLEMDPVNAMLDQATRRLLSRIADTMQTLHVDATRIAYVRAACETTRFPVDWPSLLLDMQRALFSTAYSRCSVWRRRRDSKEDAKRKSDDKSGHPPLQIPASSHGSAAQTSNSSSKKRKHRKGK